MSDQSMRNEGEEAPVGESIADFNRLQAEYTKSLLGRDMTRLGANMRDFTRAMPERVRTIGDLIPPGYNGESMIFVGSGASVWDEIESLKSAGTTVIASPSCIPFLREQGVMPDLIVCADVLPIMREMLRGYEKDLARVPIVLPASADPAWRQEPIGSTYYYYMPYLDGPEENKAHVPINQLMHGFVPQVTEFVLQAGCVANMVAGLVESFVRRFRVKKLALVGVDFSEGEMLEDERVPFHAGRGSPAFVWNLADKDVYKRADFPVGSQTRKCTYVDMIYGAGMLQIARDVSYEIVNTSPVSILAPFMKTMDLETALLAKASAVDPTERNEALVRYLQIAAPLMNSLSEMEKARIREAKGAQYQEVIGQIADADELRQLRDILTKATEGLTS